MITARAVARNSIIARNDLSRNIFGLTQRPLPRPLLCFKLTEVDVKSDKVGLGMGSGPEHDEVGSVLTATGSQGHCC